MFDLFSLFSGPDPGFFLVLVVYLLLFAPVAGLEVRCHYNATLAFGEPQGS